MSTGRGLTAAVLFFGWDMTNTELYDRLGVEPDASSTLIRNAFRRLSKTAHPDVGGDEEDYKKLTEAYEILMDKEKRARYDKTGRYDKGVTKERVTEFIHAMFNNVVNVDPPPDNPMWDNVLAKVVSSMRAARTGTHAELANAKIKLRRTRALLKRFKPLQDEDPVGDALRQQERNWLGVVQQKEDAIELSRGAEEVLKGYRYEVGPDPEGQDESDPTLHLTSGGVLRVRAGR